MQLIKITLNDVEKRIEREYEIDGKYHIAGQTFKPGDRLIIVEFYDSLKLSHEIDE